VETRARADAAILASLPAPAAGTALARNPISRSCSELPQARRSELPTWLPDQSKLHQAPHRQLAKQLPNFEMVCSRIVSKSG